MCFSPVKRAWSEIQSAFEDQFPSGRPAWESVLGDACVFVEDAQPFSDLHLKVFEGIGDSSPSGHQEQGRQGMQCAPVERPPQTRQALGSSSPTPGSCWATGESTRQLRSR